MNKYEYFADDDDGHDFAGTSDLAGIELAKRRAMEDLTDVELEDKLAADLSVKRNYAGAAGGYDDFAGLGFESSDFTSTQNYLNSESGGTKFNKNSKVKFKGRGDANLLANRGSENSASEAGYGNFAGANLPARWITRRLQMQALQARKIKITRIWARMIMQALPQDAATVVSRAHKTSCYATTTLRKKRRKISRFISF